MPRTGGVYSPPAGTKGTPGTTIQSSPYNTFIDDLTADANAARPITAGGTGATSASAARTALGLAIGTNVQAYDAGLQSIAGLTTAANQMIYTTALDVYATTAFTPFARTILDDADASTVLSTLGVSTFVKTILDDANAAAVRTTIGLADVASSGSASDLTTGTVADARLPSSMANKTLTGTMTFNGLASFINAGNVVVEFGRIDGVSSITALDFHTGATAVDYDSRLTFTGGTGSNGGGSTNLLTSSFTRNGNQVWDAATDGAGSGLDADLLDGQEGSYYTNIVGRLGYTPVQQGGGTGQGTNKIYIGWLSGALGLQVDSTNYASTWPINITGNSANASTVGGVALSGLVQTSRSVATGTGLTGGGGLSADLTLSVDSTVWRDGDQPTAAQIGSLYAGNVQGTIGTYAFALKKTAGSVNPGSTVAGTDLYWSNTANSAVLGIDTGTWRAMGVISNTNASLALRIS